MEITPSNYRIRVHSFGAASSPGCSNFGLNHLATHGQYSKDTIRFNQKNVYVDDGLISVQTATEAIELIEESRELCFTSRLRLHKFVSNSERVMATIPKEERTTAEDLDMALSLPQMGKALGVVYYI